MLDNSQKFKRKYLKKRKKKKLKISYPHLIDHLRPSARTELLIQLILIVAWTEDEDNTVVRTDITTQIVLHHPLPQPGMHIDLLIIPKHTYDSFCAAHHHPHQQGKLCFITNKLEELMTFASKLSVETLQARTKIAGKIAVK